MLKVTVDTDNAAFGGDDGLRDEAARILRRIAAEIENGRATGKFQTVFDINGNDVGRWKLSREGGRLDFRAEAVCTCADHAPDADCPEHGRE